MGQRKKIAADARKEAMKTVAIAHLRNVPTSPRRMRQVADLIRAATPDSQVRVRRPGSEPASGTVRHGLRP